MTHPFLFSWIESDLPGWLSKIEHKLESDFQPHDCLTVHEPKGNYMVRPGALLDIEDELVYSALLGSSQRQIVKALGWSQGDPDVAYQLQKSVRACKWIQLGFPVWNQWRIKSLAKLRKEIRFVVFADIAAFYENIDLNRLASDLRSIGVEHTVIELLNKCLKRWSYPREKGIPQGLSPSDLLAKVYLNPIDKALRNSGFKHLRYVDDVRIFCRTKLDAKRALLTLNNLLRTRGLNLQSAKTEILQVDEALKRIDGVSPVIGAIQAKLGAGLRSALSLRHSYATLAEIEKAMAADPNAPPLDLLEQAFDDHFASTNSRFDKTLFHFLLTRLGKVKSRVGVSYCIQLLLSRPEETENVLRYLQNFALSDAQNTTILKYAESKDAIYDYQLFQIISFFVRRSVLPRRLLRLCRGIAFDKNRDPWLRTISLVVLGTTADPADLEKIEGQYGSAATEVEKAEIVAALRHFEIGRRNGFYNRVSSDGELVRRAVDCVRLNKSLPL